MTTPDSPRHAGKRERRGFPWITNPPTWAQRLQTTTNQILTNQEKHMALTDDLKAQITALQTEDGVIITALNDLLSKAQAQGGSVSDTDVQGAIDSIKAELARVDAVVQADDPTPTTR